MYKKQILIIISLSAVILQTCSSSPATQTVAQSTATATILPSTPTQTEISSPTNVTLTTPTSLPLTWKLVNNGQEFNRDTVTEFAIDPNDSNVLYVHMQNAGYYKSIDGGISWQPIRTYDIPDPIISELDTETNNWEFEVSNHGPDGNIRQYRFDGRWWNILEHGNWRKLTDVKIIRGRYSGFSFNPAGELYVFCGENICKFNSDATEMNILGMPDIGGGSTIRISPKDPNIIYVSGRGMAVSKDGGYTWTKSNNGLGSDKAQLVIGADSQSVLYLLLGECSDGWAGNGWEGLSSDEWVAFVEQPLYRSNDNGITWKLIDYRGCYLIKDADGMTYYRIIGHLDTSNTLISKFTDKSAQLERIEFPHSSDYFSKTILAAHPTQHGLLYAYDSRSGNIFLSENSGYTWKQDLSRDIRLCYGSTMHFIDAYRPMAIDPFDGNHVFVIEHGLLLESHDSCDTTKTFATAINASMNTIAFDPNKSGTLYAGTDKGAYISFDSGATWNQINEGLIDTKIVYSIVVDKDGNVYAATPFGIFKLEGK